MSEVVQTKLGTATDAPGTRGPSAQSAAQGGTSPVKSVDGLGQPLPSAQARARAVLKLDAPTYDRALDCVHCGLCLPSCPTYAINGLEADSPRGRIYFMKGLADGRIAASAAVTRHLDLCLDCRACETACPSGVVYHELIEETRARLAAQRKLSLTDRLVDTLSFRVFPYPGRLRLALLGPRLLQKLKLWGWVMRMPLAGKLGKLRDMLPADGPVWEGRLQTFYPARAPDGQRRARVAFFAGCIGSVLFQDVNRQAIALLQRAGCDVLVPPAQGCCGAIHHHSGRPQEAMGLARRNLAAFLGEAAADPPSAADLPDFIVTAIAGCGAMLREYDHLLPSVAAAQVFARRVRDISEVLAELGLPAPQRSLALTATYHDACHLAHAQRVTEAPRSLLAGIPGLKLVPLPEADLCCGAAGTYNLSQPEMARDLGMRKIRMIQETGASVCITGNVGCAMQIQSEARRLGVALRVVHPVTLLHEAHFGGDSRRLSSSR